MCLFPTEYVKWSFSITPNATSRTLDSSADPTCLQWGGTTVVVADHLSYDTYTATLTVNSIPLGQEFYFFGSVVSVSIGPTGTQAKGPVIIDDTASSWVYTPISQWIEVPQVPEAVAGSYSQTCDYNGQNIASATYVASNTSALYVVGMLGSTIAFYTVQLNGEEPLKYNAYDFWEANQQVLFFTGGLDPTQQYTIQLQNYDTDYQTSPINVNCLSIDAIYLIEGVPPQTTTTALSGSSTPTSASSPGSSDTSLPTSGGSSSPPVGAIVGGVVGGLAVIAILIAALVLLLRRRNRAHADMPVTWKPGDDPGLGPDTVPIPFFHDTVQVPVQSSGTGVPLMSNFGDGSAMDTSIRTPTTPPPTWLGREKSPAATHGFGRSAGILTTPFIPPSNNFLASSSTGSPSVAAPSVIDDPAQRSSPANAAKDRATSPLQSEGYPSELPTYDSLGSDRRPSV
ncbi:hypothetical protein CALVIDRAFT_564842 [Calocera viscosa TUFC12733]|uniref:Transmembrane protein n=1 Tax=Calocera viscosa (strain TUFC12733) TaxID=1330018 RepID=A0A167L8F7_CALVF|nr:hypothetical protein CALVIDRAFT_564842 [Calocera viscosa TUFC12733]